MAVDIAALDHAVVAGDGDGAGDFQSGVQNGFDNGVVEPHLRHQTDDLTVLRNGAEVLLDAGGAAPVDGQGAVPVRGAPADDIGVHQIIAFVGSLQIQHFAQTVVFTGDGVGLTGHILHLGDFGLQRLVFGGQSLIAEHIAVVFFRGSGQGVAHCPDGSHQTLHKDAGGRLVGNTGVNAQRRSQHDGQHQNDCDFCAEQMSHGSSPPVIPGQSAPEPAPVCTGEVPLHYNSPPLDSGRTGRRRPEFRRRRPCPWAPRRQHTGQSPCR